MRWPDLQGSQDGPLGLLALLQGPAGGEPGQASHHHPQGRPVPGDFYFAVGLFSASNLAATSKGVLNFPLLLPVVTAFCFLR